MLNSRKSAPEATPSYYRARYYDPSAGRFFSEDPLQFRADINFYRYVKNNPMNNVDPSGLCKILFNGSQILIETNNGSQRLGPFPAANRTVCDCKLKQGVYLFDKKPQWLYRDGAETELGSSDFDGNRNRHEAFGSARISMTVPGRPGIMIHARYPDTDNLRPTEGCVRVHDAVAVSFSLFIEAVCKADEPNSFHYFERKW